LSLWRIAVKAKSVDESEYQKVVERQENKTTPSVLRRGSLTVSRHYKSPEHSSEDSDYEDLDVAVFETDPAHVEVLLGRTMNMGDFESVRVDVRVQVPCYVEEMDSAYDFAHSFARERIETMIRKIRGRG
jgi:hypothetical protein